MTTNNIADWRSQTFYETHIAYRLALIHYFTCSSKLSLQAYNLSSELPTQTHANANTIASEAACSFEPASTNVVKTSNSFMAL